MPPKRLGGASRQIAGNAVVRGPKKPTGKVAAARKGPPPVRRAGPPTRGKRPRESAKDPSDSDDESSEITDSDDESSEPTSSESESLDSGEESEEVPEKEPKKPLARRGRPASAKTLRDRNVKECAARAAAELMDLEKDKADVEKKRQVAQKQAERSAERQITHETAAEIFHDYQVLHPQEYRLYQRMPQRLRAEPSLLVCKTCYSAHRKCGKAFFRSHDYYQLSRHLKSHTGMTKVVEEEEEETMGALQLSPPAKPSTVKATPLKLTPLKSSPMKRTSSRSFSSQRDVDSDEEQELEMAFISLHVLEILR